MQYTPTIVDQIPLFYFIPPPFLREIFQPPISPPPLRVAKKGGSTLQ